MESTTEKIIRKTGRKPISCKCTDCKKQCTVAPCLGTPQDIDKLIDAGYGDSVIETEWAVGQIWGIIENPILMHQIKFDKKKGACVFFNNGLCDLHDKNLKPTEGRLSHHSTRLDTFTIRKSISWNVAKEWIDPKNADIVNGIYKKKLPSIISEIHKNKLL